MAKNITVIPATLDRHTGIPSDMHYKRRVAGYARVSTDSEEQLTSYEAQVDYYTQYIKANPEWQFVAVYTDEGISATNTKHRDGFNRMVQDALDGKIEIKTAKLIQFDFSQCRNVLRGKLLGPRGKFGEMRGKLLREG